MPGLRVLQRLEALLSGLLRSILWRAEALSAVQEVPLQPVRLGLPVWEQLLLGLVPPAPPLVPPPPPVRPVAVVVAVQVVGSPLFPPLPAGLRAAPRIRAHFRVAPPVQHLVVPELPRPPPTSTSALEVEVALARPRL